MKRWTVRIAAAIALIYVAACGWVYSLMRKPPEEFAKSFARLPSISFMALPFKQLWMKARAGSLEAGSPAPDFDLRALDQTRVRLSDLRGKPVLLVFGSYT